MSYDDGAGTRHAARTPGIPARDRILILATVALIGGAIVLSLARGEPGRTDVPGPSRLAALPSDRPTPTMPGGSPTPAPASTPAPSDAFPCAPPEAGIDPWQVTACDHRGENARRFEYACPAGGTPGSVWGDVGYTDDSSVCGAAVHSGVLTPDRGGTVTIVIRPGRAGYIGTARNGILSMPWDAWGGSFEVLGTTVRRTPGCGPAFDFPAGDAWRMTTCAYRGDNGRVLDHVCPRDGQPAAIWGDGIYTDDSSVCTAAVHSGALVPSINGNRTVHVVVRPGQDAYGSMTRNGITSEPWGHWDGSFEFVTQ